MQQITLTEYTESYAVSVEDVLPENEAVFFKTTSGRILKGEYFPGLGFESKNDEFEVRDIFRWHPVTVDL